MYEDYLLIEAFDGDLGDLPDLAEEGGETGVPEVNEPGPEAAGGVHRTGQEQLG